MVSRAGPRATECPEDLALDMLSLERDPIIRFVSRWKGESEIVAGFPRDDRVVSPAPTAIEVLAPRVGPLSSEVRSNGSG